MIPLFKSTYGINIINNIYYIHLLSAYKISGNVLNALHVLSHGIHTGQVPEVHVINYHLHDNEEFKA